MLTSVDSLFLFVCAHQPSPPSESDEWQVAHARTLEEESKLIEAGFDYVRYSDKDGVAIYRERK